MEGEQRLQIAKYELQSAIKFVSSARHNHEDTKVAKEEEVDNSHSLT